jgi:hypothetical protein
MGECAHHAWVLEGCTKGRLSCCLWGALYVKERHVNMNAILACA